jgi:hypothetical protein
MRDGGFGFGINRFRLRLALGVMFPGHEAEGTAFFTPVSRLFAVEFFMEFPPFPNSRRFASIRGWIFLNEVAWGRGRSRETFLTRSGAPREPVAGVRVHRVWTTSGGIFQDDALTLQGKGE